MLNFYDRPYVIRLVDDLDNEDQILLLGMDRREGLILQDKELHWYPIEKMRVYGQLVPELIEAVTLETEGEATLTEEE